MSPNLDENRKLGSFLRYQGLLNFIGLVCFLGGYFGGINWVMIVGGIAIVLEDIYQIWVGALKYLFPVILSVSLAIAFTPWYVGLFWASAAFKILGIPGYLRQIFSPGKIIEKYEGGRNNRIKSMEDAIKKLMEKE